MKRYVVLVCTIVLAMSIARPVLADSSHAVFAYTGDPTPLLSLNDGTVVLTATGLGWYEGDGVPNGSSLGNNYIAGICGSSDACYGDNGNYHDWFTFNIPAGTVITDATLQLYNPVNGYISPNATATYTNWDVTTAVGDLGSVSGVGIFNDLGSGIMYASTVVSAADDDITVNIGLNGAALSAINADAGSQFAVGGAVNLTTTPEPSSVLLLGFGITGLIGYLRKRK